MRKKTPKTARASHLSYHRHEKRAFEVARLRLMIVMVLMCLSFTVIGGRVIDLTVLQPAEDEVARTSHTTPEYVSSRANIVDRNGVVLATSLVTSSLYANPKLITNPGVVAGKLKEIFPELNRQVLEVALRSKKSFLWIKRNLTPSEQQQVFHLGVPGLEFQREEKRVYPQGALISHVLGGTDVDGNGLCGVEHFFNEKLKSSRQALQLSLDVRAQHALHDELSAAISKYEAEGASGIIMNAKTSEVVAMVSLPDYDPNMLEKAQKDSLFNATTLGNYEMGSTFKIFTVAMGLDSGVANVGSFYDASTPLRVARFTISDYFGKNRQLSLPEVLMYSSNIGSAKLALDIGKESQQSYFERLGMLQTTGIELSETGVPMRPHKWRDINAMTISYGYGLAVTPLHVVNGVAAVVNGGVLNTPTLLKGGNQGVQGKKVFSLQTSKMMRKLLRLVVTEGTGKKASVDGYLLGGKSGTANCKNANGYKRGENLTSFVGAFPIHNPEYVVIVLLNKPKGIKETLQYNAGGWNAAPVTAKVVERVAPLLNIAPQNKDAAHIKQALSIDIPQPQAMVHKTAVRYVEYR